MASTAMSQALVAQKNEQTKAVTDKAKPAIPPVSEERVTETIQQLAYALWERRGCPAGSAEQDWREAEEQVLESQPGNTLVGR